jgi:hypothetical protein
VGLVIRWALGLWYARLRWIDREILWPTIKAQAPHSNDCDLQALGSCSCAWLDHARTAFAVHALSDSAWLFLGYDEIKRQIGELS